MQLKPCGWVFNPINLFSKKKQKLKTRVKCELKMSDYEWF